jgi:hypothetical protein
MSELKSWTIVICFGLLIGLGVPKVWALVNKPSEHEIAMQNCMRDPNLKLAMEIAAGSYRQKFVHMAIENHCREKLGK